MYQYKDGPDTGLSSGPTGQTIYSGDTTTFTGFHIKNFSNDTVADAGVWAPFTWVTLSNGTHEALTWDSTQHGWYTPNFIGDNGQTGESLLLTAKFSSGSTTIAAHPLRAANVADGSGAAQYPLDSAAFLPAAMFPPETIQPTDLLPFGDLGSFAGGQTKAFDLSFTAHWGGKDLGPIDHAGGWIATLEPENTNRVGGAHSGDTLFGA
jgi:hypothetical protein